MKNKWKPEKPTKCVDNPTWRGYDTKQNRSAYL